MRSKTIVVGTVGTVAAVLTLGSIAFLQPVSAQNRGRPGPPVPAFRQNRRNEKKHEERHHFIYDALTVLENAKNDLRQGTHDYGGHRQKALEHTNRAIAEVKAAIAWHEQHGEK